MLEQLRRCIQLIDAKTWLQAGSIGILILVSAGFEAIGIGLIFPFIQLLADPDAIHRFEWLSTLVSKISGGSHVEIIITLSWGLLIVFVLKNVFITVLYTIQLKFLHDNQAILNIKLYKLYLMGPYRLHLTRNSAELITNIMEASNAVFTSACMGYITLLSEAALVLGIAAILFIADPAITLAAILVLFIAFGGFFFILKNRLATWGESVQESKRQILKALQQGLHNLKEVKVLGRERYVAECFQLPRWNLATVTRAKNLGERFIPRIWMEIVMVSCMLGAVIYFLEEGRTPAELLATISLFAVAAFRLLPSANRALIALNGIKAGSYSVDVVYNDVVLFENNAEPQTSLAPIKFENEIKLENATFRYPGGDRNVLEGIDLTIQKGHSIGLVGPSGSGKTTMVDIILGLIAPTNGVVTVDAHDIRPNIRSWRQQVGYVPQSIYILDDTLRRNIAFGIADEEIDPEKMDQAISLARLTGVIDRLPDGIDTNLGERGVRLSGGEAQRVGIARALYNDPPVLVLDEATSALDNETEREINAAIERLSGQKTLIIIAHRLSTVRSCETLILLKDGRIANTGSFDELLEKDPHFKRMVEFAEL